MSDDEQAGNDELLVLRSSWPVSTIGGEPSITTKCGSGEPKVGP